jgi:hypothetical protein
MPPAGKNFAKTKVILRPFVIRLVRARDAVKPAALKRAFTAFGARIRKARAAAKTARAERSRAEFRDIDGERRAAFFSALDRVTAGPSKRL